MKNTHKRWLAVIAVACGLTFTAGQAEAGGCFGNLFESNACDTACCDLGIDTSCCDSDCCEPDCGCEFGCETECCDSTYGCDSAVCGGSSCLDSFAKKLTGLGCIQKSDHCFDDFISPMIDFVHFEDPRNLTEVRPMFVTQNLPTVLGNGAASAGGSFQLFALQFRIALTERLSLIAVKDGYIIDNSEGALDTLFNSGWADITAGLKYNLIRNVETGTLLSGGFTYEIPLGSEGALQAQGDGQFHFFATGGQRLFGGNAHILSSVGWQMPVDQSTQETTIHWNNHFDVRLMDKFYLFTENSWWHWTDDVETGNAFGVAGTDLLNLGDTDVEGNHLVTHNVGAKYKPNGHVEIGAAYEFPLTGFQDLIEDRWTFETILRY